MPGMSTAAALLIGTGVSGAFGMAGLSQSQQAYKAQQEAQIAGWEEKIRSHEYNIERIKEELSGQLGDITKGGERFQRLERAYMGASGAEIGTGIPLMNMIATAAGIETSKRRLERLAELQIEYLEEEIAETEELLKPPPPPPDPKKGPGDIPVAYGPKKHFKKSIG